MRLNYSRPTTKRLTNSFDRLEAASRKAKLVVFKQIKSELDLHAHIEEKFLYPALESRKKLMT
jgi:hypothetical protein